MHGSFGSESDPYSSPGDLVGTQEPGVPGLAGYLSYVCTGMGDPLRKRPTSITHAAISGLRLPVAPLTPSFLIEDLLLTDPHVPTIIVYA